MPKTHSSHRIGDSVRVKAGIHDPDFGVDSGGWQGRISNSHPSGHGILVSIQWDSITLKEMPVARIEQCEEQGLDWAGMALGANEVEPAKPRDTERDVAKIKEQLSDRHGWVALGEEGKRIRKVLAAMDADDDLMNSARGKSASTRICVSHFKLWSPSSKNVDLCGQAIR